MVACVGRTDRDDPRTLAVLTTWLGAHLAYVSAHRLVRLVWALLERDASLSTTELARAAYGSAATALTVRRQRRVLDDAATHA